MNRRDFLVHTANADCALTELTPCSALAQGDARARTIIAWKKRIDEMLGCGGLPIIDPQVTYVAGRTNVMRMLQNMKKLDVAQIAFAAANAPDSSPSPELHCRQPEFFIPTINSGEFKRWPGNPEKFLDGIERDLKSGAYFLMGVYEFRDQPSPSVRR